VTGLTAADFDFFVPAPSAGGELSDKVADSLTATAPADTADAEFVEDSFVDAIDAA